MTCHLCACSKFYLKKNTDGTFFVFIWIYSIRNTWIVFFVDGDPENQFNINPEYGSILTSKRLDREKRDHYNLTVMATDGIHQTSVKVIVVYSSYISTFQ